MLVCFSGSPLLGAFALQRNGLKQFLRKVPAPLRGTEGRGGTVTDPKDGKFGRGSPMTDKISHTTREWDHYNTTAAAMCYEDVSEKHGEEEIQLRFAARVL